MTKNPPVEIHGGHSRKKEEIHVGHSRKKEEIHGGHSRKKEENNGGQHCVSVLEYSILVTLFDYLEASFHQLHFIII